MTENANYYLLTVGCFSVAGLVRTWFRLLVSTCAQ